MRKIKILIVEDEAIVAKDTENMLDSLGYKIVEIVTNGMETLKKIEEIHPDLVLMDIVLTGNIDGIQIAEQIRDLYNIPVIYVTAYADNNTLQRAKITDPFGYILKPFEERELHAVIEMALYKHKINTKLKESEERFRAIFETAQDSVFNKDCTSKYTLVNPAMEKLFGLPASKLIGKTDDNLFDKETALHLKKVDSRVLKGEIIEEEYIKKIKGIPFTFHIIKVPLYAKSGKIIGLCGIARDITERKKTREELEKRLRELETYYKVSIGRETRIIELKHQVNELLEQLGKEKKFKV